MNSNLISARDAYNVAFAGEFSMEYKVTPHLFSDEPVPLTFFLQNHMPVLPHVQKELKEAHRKTLPQAEK